MNKKGLITKIALFCTAFLLIVSTSAVITLAKYVKTSSTPEEVGTVAKFGVTMSWTDNSAFEKTYTADTSNSVSTAVSGSVDKIAPGTTGSITLTLGGSSEVAFNLTLTLVEEYSANWKVSGESGAEAYNPIDITVTSTVTGANVSLTHNKNGTSTLNVKDFEAGATISGTITITWNWAFEGNDAADNYMESLDSATYSLTAQVTATQIN